MIDRFHVACHYRDAVDELRKQEVQRRKKELPKYAADVLKHTLWRLRKRAADLDAVERARLDTRLAYSLALLQAYALREQLDTWLDRIASYFVNHQTSSFVEGLNNKLKVLKRRCYGLRNVARLFQRLTRDVEGYRRFSPWRALHLVVPPATPEEPLDKALRSMS